MRRAKYRHMALPGVFLDKVIPDFGFTDDAVVQCDVPVIKILLQMVIYKSEIKFDYQH